MPTTYPSIRDGELPISFEFIEPELRSSLSFKRNADLLVSEEFMGHRVYIEWLESGAQCDVYVIGDTTQSCAVYRQRIQACQRTALEDFARRHLDNYLFGTIGCGIRD